ncbi:cytochrome c oxidase subunit III [Anaerolineales bacterium]|jgi:heme/copper-type cytochrome/quinol oxidase subunit 3
MTELTVAQQDHHDLSPQQVKQSNSNQKLAMWIYLGSETVIFAVLIVGYIIYRFNEPASVRGVHESLGIALVTLNTFILLTSSYAMVMGLRAMKMGNRSGFTRWIGLTALLGFVFMIGQFIEYQELAHLEITISGAGDPNFAGFGMRFYVPTFFHGVHVLIGVIWALLVLRRGANGRYDQNPIGIEVFGLYWHFVDVVWIMLFTFIYLI